jgi:hypothetical protein
VSLAFVNKVNTLYSHQRSVDGRAPAKEISPLGKVKLRHHEENLALGQRHHKESNELQRKHNAEISSDHLVRAGGSINDQMAQRQQAERKALHDGHRQSVEDMRVRQRLEIDRHLQQHGTAA